MPYIKQGDRVYYEHALNELLCDIEATQDTNDSMVGDVNYLITRILDKAFDLSKNPSYAKINAAIGVLECAKLELYRRIAVPYERKKCIMNGDVYLNSEDTHNEEEM